ncbi:MAG: S41 family peptidase [Gammaproteobacteria bacterium]|nr:S41 family peptidase [Gammaproteobacteria bacterium]
MQRSRFSFKRIGHASAALGLTAALATPAAWSASIGDLNGDGKDDILLRSVDGRWLYNAMDGRRRIANLSGSVDLPSDWSWRYAGMGDFDGDGDDDVLLRHDNGRWYFYALDGRDAPDEGIRLAMTVNPDWQPGAIGDFNGDATDDVLLRNRENGRWFYYPIEDGAVATGRGTAVMTRNRNWRLAGIGDLNDDGNDDVLLRHANGRWWYYPMDGRRHIVAGRGLVNIETSEDWQIAGIGDFDGVGGEEILLRHADGRWQHYAMDGRTPVADDSGPARITRNDDFAFAGIGDLNGDGNDDVLLRRGSGHWYYYPMAGRDFIAGRGTTNVTAQRRWNMADLATGWDPTEFYVGDTYLPFRQREYNVRFKDYCAVPRTGVDADGNPFPDKQGSTWDENNWLRSWSHDTYLWYDEIEDADPACCDTPDYFGLLKTFERAPSGAPKDRFHFSQNTAEYRARVSTGAVGAGYGASFAVLAARPPREIRVRYTEPNSPATQPGVDLARGAEMLEVDGVDIVNGPTQADVDVINAALWPRNLNETHQFRVRDLDGTERSITMTSANITTTPVQHDQVLETDSGPVGYVLFRTFGVQSAEKQLVDAFTTFENAGVTDLILDLRYNGGGFIIIANQLSYMIAGDNARGRVFNASQFNDKYRIFNPITGARLEPDRFRTTTIGWTTPQAGIPLPELDLERVFVLSSDWTCSASELVVNALRGIDVEVILVGETTCGKPYGFYSTDNCGTTYSTVQIRAVNAKNFGDYPDGFSPENTRTVEGIPVPGCVVPDDFEHAFGDPDEARVAAALQYRRDGTCPTPSSVAALPVASQQDAGPALVEPEPDIGYMIATEVPD